MKIRENGRVNAHPCSLEDVIAQFQDMSQNFVDAYKVAVDATDFADENWDYLYPKCYNQLSYDDELHQPVYAEVIDDGGVRKVNFFTMVTGAGGVSDTYKFKASTNDTDPNFFKESMVYTGTYAAGTDAPVYANAEDQGGGAELVRLWVRIDSTFVTQFTTNALTASFYDSFYGSPNVNYGGLYYDSTTNLFGISYGVVKALVNGAATTSAATFNVDNVVPLFGSRSPGATITGVVKTQFEALPDNTPVTLLYNATGTPQWELLIVERKRAIRGQATASATTSATSTFNIDTIVTLDGGVDPRTDPSSAAETVSIYAVESITLADNDKVWADWNAAANRWEARPRASTGSSLQWGEVYTEIGAMTAWGTWGEGDVQFKDDAGTDDGSPVEVENRYPTVFSVGTSVCCDMSFTPPRVVSGSCETV